jgi:single-stranded-DNA-specific exonuclease
MRHHWTFPNEVAGDELTAAGFSPVKARILVERGIATIEQAEKFLKPSYERDIHDPFLFRDMQRVVDRIIKALKENEPIAVYGDYDADGVCASAVLAETFRALGTPVRIYIPERHDEGYGLNVPALEKLAKEGIRLVITVDCGSTSVKEVARANALGMDVIITDHHERPDTVPEAFAILNPEFPEETYPWKHLAASGVAFKLAQALFQASAYGAALGRPALPSGWEKWLLELVAISTITDIVPLQDENRALVHYGLRVLRRTRRPGLKALAETCGTDIQQWDEETIGYQIGPRLNAAGRLAHAQSAVDLLLAEDMATARRLAGDLEQLNSERQRLTERVTRAALTQATEQLSESVIIVAGDDWPLGVVGITAGKLTQTFQRPAIVLSRNGETVTGSGRSIPGFDITAALHRVAPLCAKLGGHPQACGMTLAPGVSVEQFRSEFQKIVRELLPTHPERSTIAVTTNVRLDDITEDFLTFLEQLRPFGHANRAPAFLVAGVRVHDARSVGRDNRHLRLVLADERGRMQKSIGFSFADELKHLVVGNPIDVVVKVLRSEWQGRPQVDFHIVDLRHDHEHPPRE